jgi:long-chain-fatty-acid--[acyl-carrier-protein] ligase
MIDKLLRVLVRALISLRYRVRVVGFEKVSPEDGRGILFLPNHPALIDPVILLCLLTARFRPRPLANRQQVERPVIRWLARRLGVITLEDVGLDGREVTSQVGQALDQTIRRLRAGESVLLYPSGRAYRQHLEDLGGNSAVELILRSVPEVRVVLVRTRGLWGSGFSYGPGGVPRVDKVLRRGLWGLLTSGVFFAPRREVSVEFLEPDDLPRQADRNKLNRYLERFYNLDPPHNTYVPYSVWERGGVRRMLEPMLAQERERAAAVPSATRALAMAHLQEISGRAVIADQDRLGHELGLDSLARLELVAWIEAEFGFSQGGPSGLETVADVLLAASGENVGSRVARPVMVDRAWRRPHAQPDAPPALPEGSTIPEVFLRAARRHPSQAVIADPISGTKTYRDLVTALLVLKPILGALPGNYLGILLPASVAANVAYLAALFAGKTPVMLNFTTGPRNVLHAIELLGIQRIVSAGRLVERLRREGFADAQPLFDRLLLLEELGRSVTALTKLGAAWRALTSWRPLERDSYSETAVVLFTSGSESRPKAVPLTHANLLANIRDIMQVIPLRHADALLSMLPPFHSFGLTVDTLVPLLTGLRAVYHADPTDASTLAALIDAYELTALVGTPTFLGGICRAAQPGQLGSLRLAVTGAEQCPARVYDALGSRCPNALVLEGYGITECSPVVSVNRVERARRGTIGEPLPSVQCAIVDPDTGEPVAMGQRGMLLVRGPSVFAGYLRHHGESPFVEHLGQRWYRTGDLVTQAADGVLTFSGRRQRFVKLGGEMVSLPAIEAALESSLAGANEPDGAPGFAIEASPGEQNIELVLFTTLPLEREPVNRAIHAAGLSSLHNVRRIVRLDALPLLGTGKVDYRALKRLAATR